MGTADRFRLSLSVPPPVLTQDTRSAAQDVIAMAEDVARFPRLRHAHHRQREGQQHRRRDPPAGVRPAPADEAPKGSPAIPHLFNLVRHSGRTSKSSYTCPPLDEPASIDLFVGRVDRHDTVVSRIDHVQRSAHQRVAGHPITFSKLMTLPPCRLYRLNVGLCVS